MTRMHAVVGLLLSGPILFMPTVMYMMDEAKRHGVHLRTGGGFLLIELLVKYPRLIREKKSNPWPFAVYLLAIVVVAFLVMQFVRSG